jgi:thiamine-monophosphate kinase
MARGKRSGEFERIARYFAPLAAEVPGALGLRDDCTFLELPEGQELVATTDTVVEGVHYLPDDPPDLIARKALRVNLSDLAAKGAVPHWYLLNAAFHADHDDAWVAAFARGLAKDQVEFEVSLVGGDTVAAPGAAMFSVTALGLVRPTWGLRRSGAHAGDDIYVTGTIGDGALGLLVRPVRSAMARSACSCGVANSPASSPSSAIISSIATGCRARASN